MRIFLFLLAEMGLSWSITVLAIGAPIRQLFDTLFGRPPKLIKGKGGKKKYVEAELTKLQILVRCPACIGFWIALAISKGIYSPCLDSGLTGVIILASVLDGLVAVGVNWVMHVVLTRLGQYDL